MFVARFINPGYYCFPDLIAGATGCAYKHPQLLYHCNDCGFSEHQTVDISNKYVFVDSNECIRPGPYLSVIVLIQNLVDIVA